MLSIPGLNHRVEGWESTTLNSARFAIKYHRISKIEDSLFSALYYIVFPISTRLRAYTFPESLGQSSIRARLDARRPDAATELSNPEDLASTPRGA